MSMKKILMAAVAVSAIGAGSANALTLSAANTYVGVSTPLTPTAGLPSTYVYEPFTIANEYNLNSATTVPIKITAGLGAVLTNATSYLVTYTVTGGTFGAIAPTDVKLGVTTADVAGADYAAAGTVTAATVAQGPINSTTAPTQVSFVVTPGTATAQAIAWKASVKPSVSKEGVTISVGVTYLNSPTISVDSGATTPATVIDFRNGLTFATIPAASRPDATFSNASGFKKFASAVGDVLTSTIGSGIKFQVAATDYGANDKVFKDFGSAATSDVDPVEDIISAVLTVNGDLSVQKAILGASQAADSASTPGVFTANATNLAALQTTGTAVTLITAGTAAGTESSYSVTPVLTLGNGLLPLTYSAKALGSTIYEGTSIFAPWVGDGSNGINYSVRIGNKSTTASVSSVSAFLLNPSSVVAAGGTVLQTAACPLGSIAAKGELLVDSAKLAACFGAFKRSDVKFVIQGTTNVTAKMRSTSPNGTQTEGSLGSLVATN